MSSENLYEANAQWQSRPDDQRFGSISEMRDATHAYAVNARTAKADLQSLKIEPSEGSNLVLVGRSGAKATLTHHAFGQLSGLTGAPAGYLRTLPPELAATNLNHGIQASNRSEPVSLLFHQNGNLVARAITSQRYDRVWNYEICDKIASRLVAEGWQAPPARPCRPGQKGTRKATAADILPNQSDFGLAIKVGDEIAPAGLYASDHDMFAFLVNQIDPVTDGQKLLHRGVFIQNSEVGDCALKFKIFTYDNVCGNHIVWGVGKVAEVSCRHIKGEDTDGKTLANSLAKWHVMSRTLPTGDQLSSQIKQAQSKEIAATKEGVLDALFAFGKAKGLTRLTRATLAAGYDRAVITPRYGSPRSVWGMVNGLTELSQEDGGTFTDARTDLDIQAGRIMEMAF